MWLPPINAPLWLELPTTVKRSWNYHGNKIPVMQMRGEPIIEKLVA